MYFKGIPSLIIVLFLFNCGDVDKWEISIQRLPIFGFSKVIAGKEVKMVDVFDEKLSLVVSDSVRRNVQFLSTLSGERLIVDDWFFDFDIAIKYKKYYFLHQLVDSSYYKVLVVGRYFTKYYGFEEPWNQNISIYNNLSDTLGNSTLNSLKIDSLSSKDFIINSDSKKVIKTYYKDLFKGTYLRNAPFPDSNTKIKRKSIHTINVKKLKIDENMNIYPSLTRGGKVKITSELLSYKTARLSIFNISGEEVNCKHNFINKSVEVNVESLKAGSYFAVVIYGDRRSCGKFVIVK